MTRLVSLLQRYAHLQQPISLAHVEDLLRQERFTGPVTLHYRDGIPKRIEAGKPLSVELQPDPSGDDTGKDLTAGKT